MPKQVTQEGIARLTVCNNLPQPPSLYLVFWGLRKIVNSTSQCLLVSPVFGTVSSLHPTSFLMIFILVYCVLAIEKERKSGENHDFCAEL